MRKKSRLSKNNDKNIAAKRRISIFCVLILFVLYCVLTTEFLGSACPVYLIFGIPCPGCGMTRAWLYLFCGEVMKAFDFHPMFFAVPIVVFCLILCIIKPKLKKSKIFAGVYLVLCVAFLATYVYRMAVFFPDEEPINYNENSFLAILIRAFSR